MSMSDAVDTHLLNLLRKRDGAATLVELRSGNTLRVLNIAWGYDIGEPYAHVSTNVSPSIEGESFDFFHTYEVVRLRDPGTNKTLIEASGDAVAAGHWLRSLGFELVSQKVRAKHRSPSGPTRGRTSNTQRTEAVRLRTKRL